MKKKLFIVSLFIIIVTGCSATYSIDISDNLVKENLSIVELDKSKIDMKNSDNKSFYDYAKEYGNTLNIDTIHQKYFSLEKSSNNNEYYDKKFINDTDKVGFELSNNFSFYDYSNSTIANELISNFSSYYDGRYLTISGKASSNYLKDYEYLDEIEFNVKTNYKVVSTNLKKQNNSNYNWIIKEGTRENELYIKLDTKVLIENKSKDDNTLLILIILTISLIVILIVYSIYKKRNEYS